MTVVTEEYAGKKDLREVAPLPNGLILAEFGGRSSELNALTCSWKAALLTRMSSLPNSSTVLFTASLQNFGLATSPLRKPYRSLRVLSRLSRRARDDAARRHTPCQTRPPTC
jgi:hypothetical protein